MQFDPPVADLTSSDVLAKPDSRLLKSIHEGRPNTAMDAWTTKAVTRGLWKQGVPKYTVLWLSDPDASQHDSGVGSDNALAVAFQERAHRRHGQDRPQLRHPQQRTAHPGPAREPNQ